MNVFRRLAVGLEFFRPPSIQSRQTLVPGLVQTLFRSQRDLLHANCNHSQCDVLTPHPLSIVKEVGKTLENDLSATDLTALAELYLNHARFEEEVFLPVAKSILGRNGNHMEALAPSMHIRHHAEEIRRNFGVL